MVDLKGCRACLKQNCKLERISDASRRVYCAITGLPFTPEDCYPKYFCAECITHFKKIVEFRRRCRRAFFLLKEIVAVRKKITPGDLSLVDRKKTNLTSNIDYWNNNNNGFYSVNKVEETSDVKPSDVREFIKKFEPTNQPDIKPYIRVDTTKYRPNLINNTYVVVDIKPESDGNVKDEVFEEVEYLCEGDMDIDDDMAGNEIADEKAADMDNDIGDNETAADEKAADIDNEIEGNEIATDEQADLQLQDVFKDLPEANNDDDSDYEPPELPMPKKKTYKKRPKVYINYPGPILKNKTSNGKENTTANNSVCGMDSKKAMMFSRALTDFNIEVLSFEDQKNTFAIRKETEPYKSARFKCAMCLIVYPGMSELMRHVQVHNRKQKKLTQEQRKKFQCAICKDTFGCQTQLTAHSACHHWYKYSCKICQVDKYSLLDTLKCHRLPPISATNLYAMGDLFSVSDMTSQEMLPPMEGNCRLCGWPVDAKRALEEHERGHLEAAEELLSCQCDACGVWCRHKVHLESHIYTHYRTFTCRLCDQVFDGWSAAHEHLKEHQIRRCYACDGEEMFRSEEELLEHEATHNEEYKLDCNLCGLPVYSISKMYYHQLVSHGYISINHLSVNGTRYKCGMCGEEFADEASFKSHKLAQGHVEADKIGGKCESCKKIFFTTGEFIAHRRGNTVCRKFPVKCVYCDEVLKHFYMSRRHYAQAHAGQPSEHENAVVSICELCGKALAPENMKKHMQRHTQPKAEPSLTCRICDHKMYSSRIYVSHMLFNHTPKPYMCAQCPYRSHYRSECRDHILKVHAPELLYSCQKCPRRFSHLDLLEKHSLKAHGGSDDRNVYPPLKDVAGKVAVFPHMKIDGSLIPPTVIEDAGLYLYDFLCKSHVRVNWRDYYVFDTGVQPTATDPNLHRKYPQKRPPEYYRRKRERSKPNIKEDVIKAIENFSLPVKVDKKRACDSKSDGGNNKVKVPKLDQSYRECDVSADVDNVEHEEMIVEYDMPDLEVNELDESAIASTYIRKNSPQKNRSKRDRSKPNKPVSKVIVKANETVDKVELAEVDNTCYDSADVSAGNVVHEEMVQGYDMPDLEAATLGEPLQDHAAEIIIQEETNEIKFVEDECEELDMSQLMSENYQVVEENGEKYVLLNGNLYKLEFEA